MSKVISRTILSLGLCGLAAAPALARPATGSVTVHTADLNLTMLAGEQALHGRITRAVGLVCGKADPRDLRALSAIRECRAAAMTKAMPQMQMAIADARSGKGYAASDNGSWLSAS